MSEIKRIPWDTFITNFRWKQGEHIAAIAPTGAGKTTLFKHLIPKRQYNIFFGTKPDDKLYKDLLKNGFVRRENFGEIKPWENNILLWPDTRKKIYQTADAQAEAFRDALDNIVQQKAWTVWIDEAKYLAEYLGLRRELVYCVEQLRSIKASVISGAQRPAFLPGSVLSNATHVFLWKTTHKGDQEKLSDIGGIDANIVKETAKGLGEHEFIYIRSRGTQSHMVISQTPK